MIEKNNKRTMNAWCTYDWANSVYSLVITSTIFPIYYNTITSTPSATDLDFVNFFGFKVVNTVLYSYALAFSFLLIGLVTPLLSGMADYGGKKKSFMQFFATLGSIACIGLYFFKADNLEFGIMCCVLASVGYAGSLVFYDSYLPDIATPDKYDMLSAKGYSLGYLGGVVLLILNLVMISKPALFGFDPADGSAPVRFSFLMVGVWWLVFSQVSFYFLPSIGKKHGSEKNLLHSGYLEIIKVGKSLKDLPNLKSFLLSFFFYNTAVQTVMYLAASFAAKELRLPDDQLILTILIIQIVGIAGSYLFAFVSGKKGNKYSLVVMLLIWVLICIGAYFVLNATQFFMLAFVVGIVMGGIQSLSRATYSKLIPKDTEDTTSYFSFYDVTYYISIVLGTSTYGLIEHVTGSMRNSIIALAIFFVIGFLFLLPVKIPFVKKIKEKVAA